MRWLRDVHVPDEEAKIMSQIEEAVAARFNNVDPDLTYFVFNKDSKI